MNWYFVMGFILLLITNIIQLFYTTNKLITIGITIASLCIIGIFVSMYIKKSDKKKK